MGLSSPVKSELAAELGYGRSMFDRLNSALDNIGGMLKALHKWVWLTRS